MLVWKHKHGYKAENAKSNAKVYRKSDQFIVE
jgi:hypothetical protein